MPGRHHQIDFVQYNPSAARLDREARILREVCHIATIAYGPYAGNRFGRHRDMESARGVRHKILDEVGRLA